jgi:hypothetical protein
MAISSPGREKSVPQPSDTEAVLAHWGDMYPPELTASMFGLASRRPQFAVDSRRSPSETLDVGFSELGLAGLTAVDYLFSRREPRRLGRARSHPDLHQL